MRFKTRSSSSARSYRWPATVPRRARPLTTVVADTSAAYLLAQQDMHRASRDVARFFVDQDVWLTPTLGAPPLPLGTLVYAGGDPFDMRRRITDFCPFTWIANATGQPAMSVSLHWNQEGLPIGTQWMARFGAEATLFRLAAQLETARPWTRRPTLSGH